MINLRLQFRNRNFNKTETKHLTLKFSYLQVLVITSLGRGSEMPREKSLETERSTSSFSQLNVSDVEKLPKECWT